MRRVSRQPCEDGPLLEEQETEGQRQLHSLLLKQLHTDVDLDRCVAKKQCFAPASLYRPFGEQAAGVRSLSQFRALQDGEKEMAGLLELGLTDTEVQLWRTRDRTEPGDKSHGVCAAPGARQQRLQVIRDKMEARDELLNRPQRFSASRALSRREMEIEQALFQGTDRLGFLSSLYHRDEDTQEGQQGESSSNPMDSLYRDVLSEQRQKDSLQDSQEEKSKLQLSEKDTNTQQHSHRDNNKQQDSQKDVNKLQDLEKDKNKLPHLQTDNKQLEDSYEDNNKLHNSHKDNDQSKEALEHQSEQQSEINRPSEQSNLSLDALNKPKPVAPTRIDISQPIGSLCGARSGEKLTVRGEIQTITDEEILNNRQSVEEIRNIPRFRNYEPGEPSKVLCVKNLSGQASVAQLVALFSRFEQESGPAVIYRLLTGRMKGQAFITLADSETAQRAWRLLNGFRLLGKPLVVEFGRQRPEGEKLMETEVTKN